MTELVAADIGGTHARFALAEVAGGRVVSLGPDSTLETAGHSGLEAAWRAFEARLDRPLPRAAAIAWAGPVAGARLTLTNSPWMAEREALPAALGVDRLALVNDFGAVAHAVGQLGEHHFRRVCGPDAPLPREGVISVVGPGTGLGVAQLLRRGGRCEVIETEGGHAAFAPLDPDEDRILASLRTRFGRVSVERIVSGPGLLNLHSTLAGSGAPAPLDDKALWDAALAGDGGAASAALDRFFLVLGAVAGDIALVHGASAVVIAGGLGRRLADRLPGSGFPARFVAKGRFEPRMRELPVKLIVHPQPGLFGAAAAFAAQEAETTSLRR